jgi:uncharacterized protein involved in type VI secretion and phage assembly
MIVAEQASSDWIDCDGSGCPVSDLARVQVQFRADRDRKTAERSSGPDGNVANAYSDSWVYSATSEFAADIIAYRVVA